MKKITTVIFAMLLVACQRSEAPREEDTPDIEEVIAFYSEILNEYTLANQIFQDAVNNSGDAILNAEIALTNKVRNGKTDPILTIEPFDLETFPKTITINYGSGTLCRDGITRSGVISIVSTGWYNQPGSVHTSTFINFYDEIFKVEGTQIIENFGENADGNLEFGVKVENGVISTQDGISIAFDEDGIRTWIAGADTPMDIWDDEYLLDSFQYGVGSNGVAYLLVFDQPLHFDLLPRDIKSGIIDLEIGDLSDIEINYNNKTYTILGVTKSFN
ncbi:hypothetical protein EYD45_15285 [Hyunsoonleella flava]|uniref:Uncharacterized protein n=1 Tax=Hyunsoonleella flava TaxID=2527939 RepID=A0A4Q9FAF9_9FLAO|nr:hypothetical protein [Hyunsoonleella flava]TBM99778.1 hypothetical protein EYD45_15285 [Hyunsoonleella flava]